VAAFVPDFAPRHLCYLPALRLLDGGGEVDSFEQVVSEVLWLEGHWVRTSVKVNLTKEEKAKIGRPSSPRWELDIVAYKGGENSIKVVECKSYIDSVGVQAIGFNGANEKDAARYKLFNDRILRETVFNRLKIQLADCGACRGDVDVQLCLACGKIKENDRAWLRQHFDKNGWELWDEAWLRQRLQIMAKNGYENQVSAVVSKLLLRGSVE
jgi:hypothetical protein